MSTTSQQITADIKTAMRERDKIALNTLRAIKSALTNAAIEKGGAGTELSEAETVSVIRKQIKQRQDSISQFKAAGREELAANEEQEITVLEVYLPAALSQDELVSAVESAIRDCEATSKRDMGKVMKRLQEILQGRADGKLLSQEVIKRLD